MSTDYTATGPFGHAAGIYRAAGWHGTLPIGKAPGKKYPPPHGWTGHGAPYPSGADLAAWQGDPDTAALNIGLRLPEGVIGLDVDAGYAKDGITKRGDEALAELESRYGPLPPTWVSSARPAPSGIRFYRVPAGRNWPGEAAKFVEIIQAGHRYAVVWPSTNPEAGGAEYRWRHEGGLDGVADHPPRVEMLEWLPPAWVEGLALSYDVAEKANIGDGAQAQWVAKLRRENGHPACLPVTVTTERACTSLRTDAGSRHETARDALSALVRLGGEGHRGVPEAVGLLGAAFKQAVGEDRWKSGEWDRLAEGAVKLAAAANPEPRQGCEHDPATQLVVPEGFTVPGAGMPATTPSYVAEPAPGALTLPDTFWQARESLGRIRQAAHSRVRSADVVLAGVLTRLAAMVPHTLRADTGVGSAASLNLFAAIVGPSGAGKSSGLSVSRSIIKAQRDVEEFPLGSGEGIAEAFMGEALEGTGTMAKDGSEKQVKVRKQVRYGALFHSDEGASLNKLIERAGSTVGETLRTAWSGEHLGQKNGRVETTRTVPAGSYSCGLVIGYQPGTVLPLLADAEAGTPQRFIYVWAIDPTIPGRGARTPWPGEILSPFPPDVPTDAPPPGTLVSAPPIRSEPITFAGTILDELYDLEHAKATGGLPAGHPLLDPFRSQHTMLKIKVSALLALLESRRNVTEADWALAQVYLDTSDAVRIYLQELARAAAGKARAAALAAEAETETYRAQARAGVEAALGATAERRVAARLAENLHTLGGDPVPLTLLRRRIAARDRQLVDPALELAVAAGWLLLPGDGLVHAGPSRPVST